jgi:D-alanyl-D-alanine carboxypeptidase
MRAHKIFRKNTHKRHITSLILTALLASLVPVNTALATDAEERIAYNQSLPVETNQIENWPGGPTVSAESAILIEAGTGAILYAKNIHAKEYPASTTKILTTLIATERCDLDEMVSFSHAAVFDTPRDSNHIAIDEGEQLTVEECLQAILIRSANECAFALAEHISGTTWQDFGDIMNARAEELGCVDSHFVNPNGLPDEDHYTSAYDLAQIGRAFFANELLCKISTSTSLHLYPTATQPDEIFEINATQLLAGKTYEYPYLIGCKTGYTAAARSCLVSAAEKNGMTLICVVMKDEAPNQYLDTISLFEYGFSNFQTVNISQTETKYSIGTEGSFYSDIDIFGTSQPILSLNQDDYIVLPLTATFADLTSTISYDTDDERQAALITYTYQGQYLGDASVDFATGSEGYDFDAPVTSSASLPEKPQEETDTGNRVIFINVLRVFAGLLIILGVLAAISGIIYFRRHVRVGRRNWRREYRRQRRRERNFRTRVMSARRTRAVRREERKKRRHARRHHTKNKYH